MQSPSAIASRACAPLVRRSSFPLRRRKTSLGCFLRHLELVSSRRCCHLWPRNAIWREWPIGSGLELWPRRHRQKRKWCDHRRRRVAARASCSRRACRMPLSNSSRLVNPCFLTSQGPLWHEPTRVAAIPRTRVAGAIRYAFPGVREIPGKPLPFVTVDHFAGGCSAVFVQQKLHEANAVGVLVACLEVSPAGNLAITWEFVAEHGLGAFGQDAGITASASRGQFGFGIASQSLPQTMVARCWRSSCPHQSRCRTS